LALFRNESLRDCPPNMVNKDMALAAGSGLGGKTLAWKLIRARRTGSKSRAAIAKQASPKQTIHRLRRNSQASVKARLRASPPGPQVQKLIKDRQGQGG